VLWRKTEKSGKEQRIIARPVAQIKSIALSKPGRLFSTQAGVFNDATGEAIE